jgi:hypothetical protein
MARWQNRYEIGMKNGVAGGLGNQKELKGTKRNQHWDVAALDIGCRAVRRLRPWARSSMNFETVSLSSMCNFLLRLFAIISDYLK